MLYIMNFSLTLGITNIMVKVVCVQKVTLFIVFNIPTDQTISDEDIQNIVDILDLSYLEDVYTRLGLEHSDVKKAKLAAERPLSTDQAKQVLNELWWDVHEEEATREVMIAAMEKCKNYKKQTEELKQKWGMAGRLKTFLYFPNPK